MNCSLTTCPSPIRCAHSRGRGTGLSRLIFPCLKTRKIPLDPPPPLVVASLSPSGSPWVVVPGSGFLGSRAPPAWPVPAAPVSNYRVFDVPPADDFHAASTSGSEVRPRLDAARSTVHAWIAGGVTPASEHDIIASQDTHGGPGGEGFG